MPSTLHQRLIFWEGDKVETVKMVETIFYSPHLEPIQVSEKYEEGSWSAYNLTARGFEIIHQVEPRPQLEEVDG